MDAVRVGLPPFGLAALAALAAVSPADSGASFAVVLGSGSHATMVAYRDDTAASSWVILDPPDDDRYVIEHPAARFTVVVVCDRPRTEIRAWQLAAGDTPSITTDCRNDTRPRRSIGVRFADDARFVKAGDGHADARWDSALALPDGRFDWFVTDGDRRVAIIRDVPSTIDHLAVDLHAARPAELIALDAPRSTRAYTRFISNRGTEFVELPNARRGFDYIVPRSLAEPGDRYELVADGWFGGHAWSKVISAVAVPDDKVTLELPSRVPPVVDEGDTVRWSGADDAGAIHLFRVNPTTVWDMIVSRHWLAGRTHYTFDLSDLPGYQRSPDPVWGVGWWWSSDPQVLPLDHDPPIGVTYRNVLLQTDECLEAGVSDQIIDLLTGE